MNRKLLFLFTFLLTSYTYCQKTLSKDYSYKASEPYKVFDAKTKFYFAKDQQALAIKFDGPDINIQKFDTEKPAFIAEKKYEKFLPKNYQVEDVLEVSGRYIVFYSSWDGDNEKEQLFSVEIDFSKGEFMGTPKLLFHVNGKVTYGQNAKGDEPVMVRVGFGNLGMFGMQGKFEILQSHDKKNILIQYRRKPEVKRDTKSFDIIGLYAFDGDLNKLSGKEVTMPYTERRMDNLDYQLDDKGTLFLLTKVFHDDSDDDKKKRKDTVANYHIELLTIKSGSDKIEISKFENTNKFINKIWIFDTDRDYLICGGLYSNGKGVKKGSTWQFFSNKVDGFDDSDGIVLFKIKPDGSMFDFVYHDIPVELMNEFENKKTKKKNAKEEEKGEGAKILSLVLKDLSIQPDGSIVIVGEQTYVLVHNNGTVGMGGMSGMGGTSTYYTYHYDDIIAAKITADGQLGWMKKIPKRQEGQRGKGGMGYKYFSANNSQYVVFLDNVKNIDLSLDKAPAKHSDGQGGYLTAVKISDADGTLTKGSILNAREVEDFGIHQFNTNRVFKTAEKTFMVEAYKKKKEDVMIKITLE
jgi:hypothetical protein